MNFSLSLRILSGLGLALAMVFAAAPAHADSKSRVKVAMVYNIMRFTTFPGNDSTLRLCGLTGDETASDLRTLDGRRVGSARLDVVLVSRTSDMGSSCDVIYIDSAPYSSVGPARRGQIVIGGRRSFAESGGTVGLIRFGDQIRFVINDGAARRTGVRFSSQLLQLAARVIS